MPSSASLLRFVRQVTPLATLALSASTFAADGARFTPVPFSAVRITDPFFAPRRDVNRRVSLPHSLDMLEKAGNLANLDLAATGAQEGYHGPVYMDSDLFKVVEAVACSLATDPDPALDLRLDGVIAKIAAAQMKDGYLNTWYQVNAKDAVRERFTNLRDHHELYCAGHLFEAAVAHHQATKKTSLLDVATKYADLLVVTFGDSGGKRAGYCGHPEIELALIKLARETGKDEYFDLAHHFLDARGMRFFATEHGEPLDKYDGGYWQDSVPLRELNGVVGHAVRFGYLMSGVCDVVGKTGDHALTAMLKRTWKNTALKNTFITGGIGPSASNEGFTRDYDLPTLSAYQETCATIAFAMWNHRMNLLFGDAKYADRVETTLYNGVMAGVSNDGKRFFYVNPLESKGDHHRTEWFSCACCPPNVARTLAALGGYVYAAAPDGLVVNLYVAGGVEMEIAGRPFAMDVTSEYPTSGEVKLMLKTDANTTLRLRVPGWCESVTLRVNGLPAEPHVEHGYLVVRRDFHAGDLVDLELAMPVRCVEAHPDAKELRGLLAFARGPIVYAFEQARQGPDVALDRVFAPRDEVSIVYRAGHGALEMGGIRIVGARSVPSRDWTGGLYRSVPQAQPVELFASPYAEWDNREPGAMKVWLPTSPPAPIVRTLERDAKVQVSFKNWNCDPDAIKDGEDPVSSDHQPARLCHWWNHDGGTEWVSYAWEKAVTVAGVKVFWFDDTGRGACRLPKAWRLLAKDGEGWKPIGDAKSFSVEKDHWCEVTFAPLTTTALKLDVDMQDKFAAGIHEWKVVEAEADEDGD